MNRRHIRYQRGNLKHADAIRDARCYDYRHACSRYLARARRIHMPGRGWLHLEE